MDGNAQHQTCIECSKTYSNISNLRRHVHKFHPDNGDYLGSLQLRKNKKYNFSCDKCHKRFMHLRHLRYHAKKHGVLSKSTTNNNCCALCIDFSADKKTILEHYKQFHSISIEQRKFVFQTEEEFVTWKHVFENKTNSKYVVESRKQSKAHVLTDFICHRSGKYVPGGKNLRQLKKLGSNKINALCPACIKMKKLENGTCEATVIEKHVGHTNEIAYLNLSKIDRERLAVKIASNVPFEDILDEIKYSISDPKQKRLHLLTKKDLHNIKSCYNLSSSSVIEDGTVFSKNELRIVKEEPALDIEVALEELPASSVSSPGSFASKKEKILHLLEELQHNVHGMTSEEELDVTEKAVVAVKQRLADINVIIEKLHCH